MAFRVDEAGVIRCVEWEQFGWLAHGFGTRASEGWLDGAPSADVKQVHSDGIVRAERPMARECAGDALVTDRAGLWIRIRTADCLPVLFVDERRRAVGAAHCGWRGTAKGLAAATVRRMGEEYGSEPGDLRAVVGPGIGLCCFEVGPEVAEVFQGMFPERGDFGGKTKLDLAEAVYRQLVGVGLAGGSVEISSECTQCGGEKFHSFRRDGAAAGRMESGICLIK